MKTDVAYFDCNVFCRLLKQGSLLMFARLFFRPPKKTLARETTFQRVEIIRGVASGWRNVQKEILVKCNVSTGLSKHLKRTLLVFIYS